MDSLTPAQKAFAVGTMEVAAAQLAFQDEQLGKVLTNFAAWASSTIRWWRCQGDNGASGENGPQGTINELRGMRNPPESEAWMYANTSRLGGPMTYENYPVGWAWAMNTPLRWVKQYASMLGGVRNGMILSWKGHVAKPGSVCGQFSHLIDIAPTVLDAAQLPAPRTVLGTAQKPMDGESLIPSMSACNAAKPRTQYFEIGGKVGLYHDGWFLSGEDGRPSWEDIGPGGSRPKIEWTLYNLSRDFSQATDLAAENSGKLQEMKALWQQVARANNVFPLEHRFGAGRVNPAMMRGSGRTHFDFWVRMSACLPRPNRCC